MYSRAWFARFRWVLVGALLLIVVAGCSNLPLEASWASVSLYGDPAQIVMAYANTVAMVDPVDGSLTELRDSEGNVRLNDQGNPRTWSLQISGQPAATFYTHPLDIGDSRLMFTAFESKSFEVDAITAQILNPEGHALPGQVVAAPLRNGDLLYVPISSNDLVAVNAETFDVVWTLDTERGVWATPLLHEGVLYVPSMDHLLYAVDPATGEEIWQLDLGGAIASTPVVANGYMYVGSFGNKLFKISFNGSIVAEHETNEWVWGAPAVVEDLVYVADLAGYVYALRDTQDSFSELWSRQVAQRGIRPTPLVTEESLIVGSRDRSVYWISRETGEEQLKREMAGEVLSDLLMLQPGEGLALSEPMVVVSTLSRDELLVAFSLDNGERLWKYPS